MKQPLYYLFTVFRWDLLWSTLSWSIDISVVDFYADEYFMSKCELIPMEFMIEVLRVFLNSQISFFRSFINFNLKKVETFNHFQTKNFQLRNISEVNKTGTPRKLLWYKTRQCSVVVESTQQAKRAMTRKCVKAKKQLIKYKYVMRRGLNFFREFLSFFLLVLGTRREESKQESRAAKNDENTSKAASKNSLSSSLLSGIL